jgi:NADH dehydrogenase [ubiquinone] 1 alpha subcomplex assembly factor 7
MFALSERPVADAEHLPPRLAENSLIEIRPDADRLAMALGERARTQPLVALFIDYGHRASAAGDTLQAVRAHRFADALADPGAADLTAHVDFEAFVQTARTHGLTAWGPMNQGTFLLALGLAPRCERLMRDNPQAAETIAASARRLVDPDQMGELFKVVALTSPGLPPPPAFGEEAAHR